MKVSVNSKDDGLRKRQQPDEGSPKGLLSTICCGCCGTPFWLNQDSAVVIDGDEEEDDNDDFECVVEKLVIKRLPLRKFATDQELAHELEAMRHLGHHNLVPVVKTTSEHVPMRQQNSNKSIVTFSSYYQSVPPPPPPVDEASPPASPPIHKKLTSAPPSPKLTTLITQQPLNKPPSTSLPVIASGATAEVVVPALTKVPARQQRISNVQVHSFPQQQQQQQQQAMVCNNMTTIKQMRHSKQAPYYHRNQVLFTKPKSPEHDISPMILDPSIEETLQLIAEKESKRPVVNRRLIHRDSTTGRITHVFKKKIAISDQELFKLNDLLHTATEHRVQKDEIVEGENYEVPATNPAGSFDASPQFSEQSTNGLDSESDIVQQPSPSGLKWKIIIKHHESDNNKSSASSAATGGGGGHCIASTSGESAGEYSDSSEMY